MGLKALECREDSGERDDAEASTQEASVRAECWGRGRIQREGGFWWKVERCGKHDDSMRLIQSCVPDPLNSIEMAKNHEAHAEYSRFMLMEAGNAS